MILGAMFSRCCRSTDVLFCDFGRIVLIYSRVRRPQSRSAVVALTAGLIVYYTGRKYIFSAFILSIVAFFLVIIDSLDGYSELFLGDTSVLQTNVLGRLYGTKEGYLQFLIPRVWVAE